MPERDAAYWHARCDQAELDLEELLDYAQRLITIIHTRANPSQADAVIARAVARFESLERK